MLFMVAYNKEGVLHRPKGMTQNSKWPWCVRKAILLNPPPSSESDDSPAVSLVSKNNKHHPIHEKSHL